MKSPNPYIRRLVSRLAFTVKISPYRSALARFFHPTLTALI